MPDTKSLDQAIAAHYARQEADEGAIQPSTDDDPADRQEPAQPATTDDLAAAIARHYEEQEAP